MSLLQTLKSAVIRLNGDRNTLFDVPMARQKAFLESLPEPEDLLERSYAQYRCQMMLERPILRAGYQLAAMLLLPIYQRQLLRRPAPRKEQAADAVFAYDSEDTILPESLRGEFADICQVRDFQNALFLTGEDCSFLRELARRYPTAFYFRFKCMAKLAMYRSLYETYRPKAILVSEEYSYTSSFLSEYCHRLGVEHINVMHGEKLYYIRDSFFCFDRCYVWDECYRRLFCDLRTEPMQFRVELPPSMLPWEKPSTPPEVDLTYYLQAEPTEQRMQIAAALHTLQARGMVIAVRPHPLYCDDTLLEIFSGFTLEMPGNCSIEQSILRTKCAVSLYSTVLLQASINGVAVVIDDLTAPERFAQLKSLRYIMLDKPHGLLSALLQEESPT